RLPTRQRGNRHDLAQLDLGDSRAADVPICKNGYDGRLEPACDVDLAIGRDEHVDLAANAELGQVDAGLDRKARAREDETLLVRLEVVHVGPGAVRFLADAVARPAAERRPVAGLVNDVAGGGVDFPAAQGRA